MNFSNIITSRLIKEAINYSLSRELIAFTDNVKINNNIRQQLSNLLINNKQFTSIQKQFDLILYNYYLAQFLQQYPNRRTQILKPNKDINKMLEAFIQRLEKKYLNEYAQKEIQNNLQYNIGTQANNLTFSSQDVDFRLAPVIIGREFLNDNGTKYKDHILIGNAGEHHDAILQSEQIQDKFVHNGKEIFISAYLYPNNVIYFSSKEYNGYSSLQEVASIIKTQYP